jgi:uroporphyrinogen-III synthase
MSGSDKGGTVKVAVTRAAEGTERLSKRLREEGLEVAECALVRIEPIEGAAVRLDGYDWLVLTSARAVALLFERLVGPPPPVAVVGPGTAEALRQRGVEPALVASRSTQEGLVESLRPLLGPAARVLFAGAEGARDVVVRELGADLLPLYRTIEDHPEVFPEVDLVVLASASAARAFAALRIKRPCVSIGPVTSAEASRVGLKVVAEAGSQDLDGLVEAVRLAASRLASSRS